MLLLRLASVLSDDAVVNTAVALAGEKLQALALLFPAATATKTPELDRLVTAVLSAVLSPPPSDRLATAGLVRFSRTQSTPAMIGENEPLPLQSITRTPRSRTCLATPYVVLPMVPATWVPCPLQSAPLPPA